MRRSVNEVEIFKLSRLLYLTDIAWETRWSIADLRRSSLIASVHRLVCNPVPSNAGVVFGCECTIRDHLRHMSIFGKVFCFVVHEV